MIFSHSTLPLMSRMPQPVSSLQHIYSHLQLRSKSPVYDLPNLTLQIKSDKNHELRNRFGQPSCACRCQLYTIYLWYHRVVLISALCLWNSAPLCVTLTLVYSPLQTQSTTVGHNTNNSSKITACNHTIHIHGVHIYSHHRGNRSNFPRPTPSHSKGFSNLIVFHRHCRQM